MFNLLPDLWKLAGDIVGVGDSQNWSIFDLSNNEDDSTAPRRLLAEVRINCCAILWNSRLDEQYFKL